MTETGLKAKLEGASYPVDRLSDEIYQALSTGKSLTTDQFSQLKTLTEWVAENDQTEVENLINAWWDHQVSCATALFSYLKNGVDQVVNREVD